MEPMTCPQCGSKMAEHARGGVTVIQCTSCEGLFLRRVDLGRLIEAENDFHVGSGPTTQPIPRIVPGMEPPPQYTAARQPRSFLDSLFS